MNEELTKWEKTKLWFAGLSPNKKLLVALGVGFLLGKIL